jgi:putative oxidoreductase
MLSSRLSGPVLSAFRIVVGLLFACHGASSLFGVLGGIQGTGATVPFAVWPGWWAALIEFVGGVLVLLGLFTRPAAILCSGAMAYAYFTVHQPQSLWPLNNGGELAALFCWSFLTIAVLGAGAWSLDGMIGRRRSARRSPAPATTGRWQDDAARNLHRHGAEHTGEEFGGRRARMAHREVMVGASPVARRSGGRPSRAPRTAPGRGRRSTARQSFRRARQEPR